MSETYYLIKDLINDLERGRIRIPSFQRGFVWNPEQVAYFIDSIYRGFPFGSVLLWRTRNPLRTERNLGPYKLPNNEPEYPIDYALDGQQRITSIFGIFILFVLKIMKKLVGQIYFLNSIVKSLYHLNI